jgi:hypothetical protein
MLCVCVQIEVRAGMNSCAGFIVKCVCCEEFKKLSRPIKFCETLKVLLLFLFLVFVSDLKTNNKRGFSSINAFPTPFPSVSTNYTVCPVWNTLNRTCRGNQHFKVQQNVSNTCFWGGGGIETTTGASSTRRPCPRRTATN